MRHDGPMPLENVTCVIVSFRPEIAQLRRLCEDILVDGENWWSSIIPKPPV